MRVIILKPCQALFGRIARRSKSAVSLLAVSALVLALGCNERDETKLQAAKPMEGQAHGGKHDDHEHGNAEHAAEVKLTADAIRRYGIKVEAAQLWRLQPTFTAAARVAFNQEAVAHVGSPLPGRVVELTVRLGDQVQQGDVLLIIESPELGEAQSEFLQKEIAAKTAVAAVDLAKNGLDRVTRLYDQNRGIALDEVQKREVEYKSVLAALQTSQAAATAAENKLHLLGMNQESVEKLLETGEVNPRFPITAPIPGQVVEREVTLGEFVNPDRESFLVLADVTTVWVLADVPEARIKELSLGAVAWIEAGSVDPHRHEGQISYIAPMVDPRTRTASVRIVVKCEEQALLPGVFVRAEITSTDRDSPEPSPVVAVPEEAVQTIDNETVIFVPVPNEENTFVKRTITVGKPVAGLVPVLSGLVEGEQFVASGSFLMKADLGRGAATHEH